MTIFTFEIDELPIAAFGDVAARTDAVTYFGSDAFLNALSGYQIAGVPGVPVFLEGESRTNIRPSYEDEIDQWRQTRAASVAADEITVEDKFGAFLAHFEVLEGDNDNDQEPITLSEDTTPAFSDR